MSQDEDGRWTALLEQALGAGGRVTQGAGEFNRALDHVFGLLRDSVVLLERQSHATSLFLSITALEEIAKLSVGRYRRSTEPLRRSKDPLYSHRDKHYLATRPTIMMGSRLTEAIGEEAIGEIMDQARGGALVALRESSLYLEAVGGALRVPSEIITATKARAIILFSLEAFDDALVGYTNRSMEVGAAADKLFEHVRGTA